MKCCPNCFKDPFIKRYIKNNGNLGNCDYCDNEGIKTLDIQETCLRSFIPTKKN